MYLIQIDHIVYGQRDGSAFTLPEAMRAVYGCGNARVIRENGAVVVNRAGSSYAVEYAPTGRTIVRRTARIA